MTISGFSFVRNATKLYYPVKESIESILPIVDEFVIALGKGDADDHTLAEIQQIKSEKIRIVHTEWDLQTYTHASVYAQQTDVAKNACKGDWLFYLQSDEVIHEKYLPLIRARCEELLEDREVEGLLFKYRHFGGIIRGIWFRIPGIPKRSVSFVMTPLFIPGRMRNRSGVFLILTGRIISRSKIHLS
ncbi:hypothetical protein [Paraflavitalea speifideaquila]|uniref:hypothetical protein n=1 Tax=Paraflavitalea speifideaquila TaxID=3076558 RepID=UPI0028EA3F2D|nr:hypothetical protein [Paraflavitalea speifideiaquila]